ncbi:MAG TPA: lamin tail domain-containing protein [Candidatus Saccharimonadales bacterium]
MKRIMLSLCFVLSFSFLTINSARAEEASITSNIPDGALVVLSEVYPNGKNLNANNLSDESGSEFIEIYNRSAQTVTLGDYELSRSGSTSVFQLTGSLAAGAYLAIYPSFTIVNSGGTVSLTHKPSGLITSATYTAAAGASEDFSFHLIDIPTGTWAKLSPTPHQAPPSAPEEPEEEEPEQPAACSITGVHLSEIGANPSGSDTLGGEFIEFYNSNETSVSLEGCTLISDKMSNFSFTASDVIPAKTHRAFSLADKLLNSGGTVTFQTATQEEAVQYNALGDDEAWALIANSWQLTTLATPNASNQASPGKGASTGDVEVEEEPAPCPTGKYRNPETGRCKNIEASVATATVCGPGKERNAETNRCRNIATASATITPCDPGQERNPATNRCRKIATASTSNPAPCKEGYERNPETNRCRRLVSTPANTAQIDDAKKQNPTHDLFVLGAAGAAIGGFLLYEYRGSVAAQFRKLRFSKK